MDLGSISIDDSTVVGSITPWSQKQMLCSGSVSNWVTSAFLNFFLLINNMADFLHLIQICCSFPVWIKYANYIACRSSVNMHSSVDFLFYCKCLLLPPLNTHDVIYCGTRYFILVWVYLYFHTLCRLVPKYYVFPLNYNSISMIFNNTEQAHLLPWVCTIITMWVLHDSLACTIIFHDHWVCTIIIMWVCFPMFLCVRRQWKCPSLVAHIPVIWFFDCGIKFFGHTPWIIYQIYMYSKM